MPNSQKSKTSPKAQVEAQEQPKPAKAGTAVLLSGGERRVDYIRRRFAEGAKRGEIAKELGVAYQIVFAATKEKATAAATAEQGVEAS